MKDELAKCTAAEIRVVTKVDIDFELGGDLDYKGLDVSFLHAHGPPCRLIEAPSITVLGPDGSLAPLPGNPTTVTVDTRLGVGGAIGSGRLWQSWCRRPRGGFTLAINVEGRLRTAQIPGTPPCERHDVVQIRTDTSFSRYIKRGAYEEQTDPVAKLF